VLVITAQPDQKLRALQAGAKDLSANHSILAELRAAVHNILEVRLLHLEAKNYSKVLEEMVRELEASREVIRLKNLEERERSDRELALAQETQESLLPRSCPSSTVSHPMHSTVPHAMWEEFLRFSATKFREWAGVLADVSGKGISAALLSSMCWALSAWSFTQIASRRWS